MTRRERAQLLRAMRLLCTDDGFEEAWRLLRVLAGGPAETRAERAIREAPAVPVNDLPPGDRPLRLPKD